MWQIDLLRSRQMRVRTRQKTVVLTVGLLLIFSVGVPSVVSAAGESELIVTPAASTVTAGETTTVDVAVERANGGVGAAEMRVAVDDPDVAAITDVTVRGDPGLTDVTSAADSSWVDVAYATADTDDSGSVTVVTVTVEGKSDGTTGLSVLPRTDNDAVVVYDETGDGYDLSSIGDATMTVGDAGGDGDHSDADEAPTESAETPSQSTTTAQTPTQTATDESESENSPTETDSPTSTDDSGDQMDEETTQTSSPGFGALLAIGSVVIATLLLHRRL